VPVTLLAPDALLATPDSFQIIDARRRHEFEAGHIPGAIPIEWEDWRDLAPVDPSSTLNRKGYWGVLRSAPDDWYAEQLATRGLSSAGPTAVYADGPRSRG
jgi:rhodanese-related sulfurtransferase